MLFIETRAIGSSADEGSTAEFFYLPDVPGESTRHFSERREQRDVLNRLAVDCSEHEIRMMGAPLTDPGDASTAAPPCSSSSVVVTPVRVLCPMMTLATLIEEYKLSTVDLLKVFFERHHFLSSLPRHHGRGHRDHHAVAD